MSTAVYGATSVPWGALTCHSGVRAGMADVERWDRSGYASGDVGLGVQDAGLSSAQHYNMCRFTHKLYFLSGKSSGGKGKCVCKCMQWKKDKVKTMLLLLQWLHSYQQRYWRIADQSESIFEQAFLPSTSGLKRHPAFAVSWSLIYSN